MRDFLNSFFWAIKYNAETSDMRQISFGKLVSSKIKQTLTFKSISLKLPSEEFFGSFVCSEKGKVNIFKM